MAPRPEPVMPSSIEPMRATTGSTPTDDAGWAYEIKWDGMRAIAFCDRGTLRLTSSNGIDATVRFPELAPLAKSLAANRVILDGEIITFAPDGRPDFGLLQRRMHVSNEVAAAEGAATQPVAYVVFDILWLDGHDVTSLPYLERKRLLTQLVEPGPSWTVPEPELGSGAELLTAVADRGLEGLIAKRIDSTYEIGRRSSAWRKLKVRRRQELVVGGWLPGEGNRSSTLGALLVGYHDDDGTLRYAGRVGTGFTEHELEELLRSFEPLARDTTPFHPPPPAAVVRTARWLDPQIVVEVAFGEWTADGVLRHPSYLGRRLDKDPARVVREPTP
ncbi:MAG: non-homologous end-joining DNA ligase [Acidimicrobiales bacterium]